MLRGAELAKARCLLVAPFENASDVALAAEAATSALLAASIRARARVFPIAELRDVFRDTPLELPAGIARASRSSSPSSSVPTRRCTAWWRGEERAPTPTCSCPSAWRSPAITGSSSRAPRWSAPSQASRPRTRSGALPEELARPMLARLGAPGRAQCFDPERTRALRRFAQSEPRQARADPTPAAAPRAPAVLASAAPRAQPSTPRQSEWARRLAAGERVLVDDVAFSGRSADLLRDGGLADLAIALAASPGVTVRLEAFVDATADRAADARLSGAMARAAGERLLQLGVGRARLTWAGRGGESPLLPNFTARGRATNRRIEVVAAQ